MLALEATLKSLVTLSGLVLLPSLALAQVAPAVPPVGAPPAVRNPVELNQPQTPPRLAPRVQPPPPVAQTVPGAAAEVRLGRVGVSDNEALDEADLAEALAGLAGASVPLARVEEARLGILRAYRRQGYPFAAVNAGLTRRPAEDGGTVADLTFAVIEGFISEVNPRRKARRAQQDGDRIGCA